MRADTHGKQIQPDDERILKNAVTQQIAGQRGGDEFIRQAAAGNDKHGNNERAMRFHEGMRRKFEKELGALP